MERKGADGQFKVLHRIPLSSNKPIKEEPEGKRIEGMPEKQPQWIIDKKAEEKKTKRNHANRRSSYRRERRVPDPPEVIEEKRKARKLKKENAIAEEMEKMRTCNS